MSKCRSILVVDDNAAVRRSLVEVLRLEGFQTFEAQDGLRAQRTLATLPKPALLFLDLMMPNMSGWEFIERCTSEIAAGDLLIVTISAVQAVHSFDNPRPLSVIANLRKPFSIDAVLDLAEQHCLTESEVADLADSKPVDGNHL